MKQRHDAEAEARLIGLAVHIPILLFKIHLFNGEILTQTFAELFVIIFPSGVGGSMGYAAAPIYFGREVLPSIHLVALSLSRLRFCG